MSFEGLPKIDDNAKNAELAENKFRQLFSMANKFISRQDIPDKGCDFDVELIRPENAASNCRFPVQVKSIKSPVFIESGTKLSYTFETSRLNYLLKRPFAVGLVAIYAVDTDTFYYEFADRILEDINSRNSEKDWQSQKQIAIHISTQNVINLNALANIHRIFSLRFERAAKLQLTHDTNHDLQASSITNQSKRFNLDKVEDIIAFLNEYGLYLLNNYNLRPLYAAFKKIPVDSFIENETVLLIAMIVFCEVGELAESIYYATKLKRHLPLAPELRLSHEICLIKNDYNLGYSAPIEYIDRLTALNLDDIDAADKAMLSMNITRAKMMEIKFFDENRDTLVGEVIANFSKIENIEEKDGRKFFLKLWNVENYSIITASNFQKSIMDFRFAFLTGNPVGQGIRLQIENRIISEQNFIKKQLAEIVRIAERKGSRNLQACAYDIYTSNFIQYQLGLLLEIGVVESVTDRKYFYKAYNYAIKTFEMFQELCMYKNAYIALHYWNEIIKLTEYHYPGTIPSEVVDQISSIQAQYERNLDISKTESVVDNTLAKMSAMNDPNADMESIRNLTDDQILHLSRQILRMLNLPDDRLQNIVADQKALRLYYQKCRDEAYSVLRFSEPDPVNAYKTRTLYKLRHKVTKLDTGFHHDLGYLLNSVGYK